MFIVDAAFPMFIVDALAIKRLNVLLVVVKSPPLIDISPVVSIPLVVKVITLLDPVTLTVTFPFAAILTLLLPLANSEVLKVPVTVKLPTFASPLIDKFPPLIFPVTASEERVPTDVIFG